MCLFDDKRKKNCSYQQVIVTKEQNIRRKKGCIRWSSTHIFSVNITKGYSLNRTFIDGRLISEQSIASNECV